MMPTELFNHIVANQADWRTTFIAAKKKRLLDKGRAEKARAKEAKKLREQSQTS